jgi:hypothetical protein
MSQTNILLKTDCGLKKLIMQVCDLFSLNKPLFS